VLDNMRKAGFEVTEEVDLVKSADVTWCQTPQAPRPHTTPNPTSQTRTPKPWYPNSTNPNLNHKP